MPFNVSFVVKYASNTEFKYSIGSEDLSNLQDDNVKNITIQITYKTNEKIINQEYIISTKIKK